MPPVVIRSKLLFGDFAGSGTTSGRAEGGDIMLASLGPADIVVRDLGESHPTHAAPRDHTPAHVRASAGPATPRARQAPTTPKAGHVFHPAVKQHVERAAPASTPTRLAQKPVPAAPAASAIGKYDFASQSALGHAPGAPVPQAKAPAPQTPSHADLSRQAEADARRQRFEFAQRVNKGGSIADARAAAPPPRSREPAGPPTPSSIGPMAPIGLRRERVIPQASTPHISHTPVAVDGKIRTTEHYTAENARALRETAARLQVPPEYLAQVVAHETAGTFSPRIRGGLGGRYLGLIQFGPRERRQYGAHEGQSFREQLGAAERFFLARGFKPGQMGQLDLYSTVLAGSPGHYKARDINGSVEQHVANMRRQWDRHVSQFLGGDAPSGATPISTATQTTTPKKE